MREGAHSGVTVNRVVGTGQTAVAEGEQIEKRTLNSGLEDLLALGGTLEGGSLALYPIAEATAPQGA